MSAVGKDDLTLRLSGTDFPDGEIDLDDLSRVAGSLHELATRIGRHVVGQTGPGRIREAAARAVTLRLAGLGSGSTALRLTVGEEGVLVRGRTQDDVVERLWDVVVGVQDNSPPAWTTALVAESAVRTLDALAAAAERAEFARGDGRQAAWLLAQVKREPWQQIRLRFAERTVTVSGRLEKVDLANRRFRIRDDVGNRIHLDDVADVEDAATLVGQRTTATGQGRYDDQGVLRGLTSVRIARRELPGSWTSPRTADYRELIGAAPGPDPAGLADLTVDEVDAFLAALRD